MHGTSEAESRLDPRALADAETAAAGLSGTEAARAAVEAYLASATLGSEAKALAERLQGHAFDGVGGDWRQEGPARELLDAARLLESLQAREETRRLEPLPISELGELLERALEPLGDLWNRTKEDWVLELHHTLTEPTCPMAVIRAEGSRSFRYAVHRDTVAEAIEAAARLAVKGEIENDASAGHEHPLTDRDWPTEEHDFDGKDRDNAPALREALSDARSRLSDAQSALAHRRQGRGKLFVTPRTAAIYRRTAVAMFLAENPRDEETAAGLEAAHLSELAVFVGQEVRNRLSVISDRMRSLAMDAARIDEEVVKEVLGEYGGAPQLVKAVLSDLDAAAASGRQIGGNGWNVVSDDDGRPAIAIARRAD